MLELEPIGVDRRCGAPWLRWSVIATLHSPMRPVPRVDERLGHDADRVREVDDPGIRRGAAARQLGELEHERHGPQRLGQAAGAGRLLADRAEAEGERLVDAAAPAGRRRGAG